jgi:hypothetical protein
MSAALPLVLLCLSRVGFGPVDDHVALRVAAILAEAELHDPAGDLYRQLAGRAGVDPRVALDAAHFQYDSAYLHSGDPTSLCRALEVAERFLDQGLPRDAGQTAYRQSVRDDDLARLQRDATTSKRPNCRFHGDGTPRPEIPRLDARELSPVPVPSGPISTPPRRAPLAPRESRRWRVRVAVGATTFGLGVVAAAAFGGALLQYRQELAAMRAFDPIDDLPPDDLRRLDAHRAAARTARGAAMGLATVGVVAFAVGIPVLATRGPRFTLHPHVTPRAAGLLLHLRF